MHWQVEEDDITQFVVPENVVDLLFSIECRSLPVDHAHALSSAVSQALPWFADEEHASLHPIHGADSGNGWARPEGAEELLYLSRRTKLTLRVPQHRVEDARALSGQTMDVAGNEMKVGKASSKLLAVTTTLYARYVVAEHEEDEDAFLKRIIGELREAGLRFKKVLCGKEHTLKGPDGALITRSLMVADLGFEDAILLQERGVGRKEHKKLGCGLFIPHKSV